MPTLMSPSKLPAESLPPPLPPPLPPHFLPTSSPLPPPFLPTPVLGEAPVLRREGVERVGRQRLRGGRVGLQGPRGGVEHLHELLIEPLELSSRLPWLAGGGRTGLGQSIQGLEQRGGRARERGRRNNSRPPALICLRRRSDRKDDPTKERGDAPRALRDGGRTGRKPCSELQADDVADPRADGEADARAVLQADDAAYSLAHGEAYADADVQAHG